MKQGGAYFDIEADSAFLTCDPYSGEGKFDSQHGSDCPNRQRYPVLPWNECKQ